MEEINFRDLPAFAAFMRAIQRQIGFKVSARGWAYILEQKRYINKDEFDKAANAINNCRKRGYLPIDFTAEESSRDFKGVEQPNEETVVELFGSYLSSVHDRVATSYYTPEWWEGEEYYIQMVVEKIDLVTLFQPVCAKFHIPIANSKGWSSMLQRAEYARRFAEAEDKGMKCLLLYCGDHDPDGLRISEFLRKNLDDLKHVTWSDGTRGYDPWDLEIDRFGLNHDFIRENELSWIDNLITGSGRNLASPAHKNYKMPYVQEYLHQFGARKCEANAIVVVPDVARRFVQNVIETYLGPDALDRFKSKRQAVVDEYNRFLEETQSGDLLEQIFDNIKDWN